MKCVYFVDTAQKFGNRRKKHNKDNELFLTLLAI